MRAVRAVSFDYHSIPAAVDVEKSWRVIACKRYCPVQVDPGSSNEVVVIDTGKGEKI